MTASVSLPVVAVDDPVAALREAAPFKEASEQFLKRIAALARPSQFGAGERIYAAGDAADDIFVVVSGCVEHTFKAEAGAREPLKRLGRGGVFGWAGLLLGQTRRLATVRAAAPTYVLRCASATTGSRSFRPVSCV